MHVLGSAFLNPVENYVSVKDGDHPEKPISVINLHPALPGAFDGVNSIQRAYEAFQSGEITKSGIMVHRVVKEVDRGEPVVVKEVAIATGESLESFEDRMRKTEWEVIVQATAQVLT